MINKRLRKPQQKSRMGNPETDNIGHKKTQYEDKQNKTQRFKADPTKTRGEL